MENIKKQIEDRLQMLLKNKEALEKSYLELSGMIKENKKILSLFNIKEDIKENG